MDSEILIVSGLPRSGTSLMMQMLVSGGLEALTDNVRTADTDNPRGYYEFEQVKKIKQDASWLPGARGKVVKMVSQLLYDLPASERYRIVFMERDLEEVLASQEKMLTRLGRTPGPREQIRKAFTLHLERLHHWLGQQPHMGVLCLSYNALLQDPHKQAERVRDFLGRNVDLDRMVAQVDGSLYRNRKGAAVAPEGDAGGSERRFRGAMSEDYLLIRSAVPGFNDFQRLVAETVAAHPSPDPSAPLRVLDVGCGDGVTAAAILSRRPDAVLTALDSEEAMAARASERLADFIGRGRCRVVLDDALAYLRGLPASCLDVVASALALHNLPRDYRRALHREVYRVLVPGGLFANADKYANDDADRFERLRCTLERFFDSLVPLGKLDLLRACVLHEVADEEPERVMWAAETVTELTGIGFCDVSVRWPHPLAALLVATRPGTR